VSTTVSEMDSTPQAIWALLADAHTFGAWVIGSKEIRDSDAHWPEPGATFHHTQGTLFVTLKDTTTVVKVEPERRLVLEVRARPWVVNIVELVLEPVGEGRTRVSMHEHPREGLVHRLWNPLLDGLLHARNVECLRRLGRLARERAEPNTAA